MKKIFFLIVLIVLIGVIYFLEFQKNIVGSQNGEIKLPINYTLDSYKIMERVGPKCDHNSDCILPDRYAIQSNCPYVTLCLENTCTVVCPSQK